MLALDVSKTAEMGVKWTRIFTLGSSNAVRSGYLRDSALVWGFGLLEAGADPGFLQGGGRLSKESEAPPISKFEVPFSKYVGPPTLKVLFKGREFE